MTPRITYCNRFFYVVIVGTYRYKGSGPQATNEVKILQTALVIPTLIKR